MLVANFRLFERGRCASERIVLVAVDGAKFGDIFLSLSFLGKPSLFLSPVVFRSS